MTGAAIRKAIPATTGRPLLNRRRVSGTTPHSQTGKTIPSNEPVKAPVKHVAWDETLDLAVIQESFHKPGAQASQARERELPR